MMIPTLLRNGPSRFEIPLYGALTALLLLVCAGWCFAGEREEEKRCALTRYLENPDRRAVFEENLERARREIPTGHGDVDAMYGAIIRASFNVNLDDMDRFSRMCMNCHDGVTAPDVSPRIMKEPDPEHRMQAFSGKHPIGMDYERHAMYNPSLRRMQDLNPALTLVGGKVSCVTCHDPLNPQPYHLVLNDGERGLCGECHNL